MYYAHHNTTTVSMGGLKTLFSMKLASSYLKYSAKDLIKVYYKQLEYIGAK